MKGLLSCKPWDSFSSFHPTSPSAACWLTDWMSEPSLPRTLPLITSPHPTLSSLPADWLDALGHLGPDWRERLLVGPFCVTASTQAGSIVEA